MEELCDSDRIGDHRPEVHHFVADGIRIELHAHRMLHPAVGDKYPQGRDGCAYTGKPCGSQMKLFSHLVPAEKHHSHESRFHKKCKDALYRKRGAENITYKPGVVAPVGPEFKFEDNACGYADSEINPEYLLPEPCGTLPEVIFLDHVDSLHYRHDDGKTEGKRDKKPMVTGSKGKLGS